MSNAHRRALYASCVMALAASVPAWSGGEAPEWLLEVSRVQLPTYGNKVPAVVLLDEDRVEVGENGRVTTTQRWAVRVLRREGRNAAVARVDYSIDGGKVADLNAWLVPAVGAVKRFGKAETLDVAVADNDVYNEERVRVINAAADAREGAVFGFEAVSEARHVCNQRSRAFQETLPVLRSRFDLVLPEGWTAQGMLVNHAPLDPVRQGTTYRWELGDLPFIEDEPARPPFTSLVPWLAVSYAPPPTRRVDTRSFADWHDVAVWESDLHATQLQSTLALARKARELTRDSSDETGRIRAIGDFVQSLPYILIHVGLGRIRPHPASEVLAKSYGDCKDKANLMRALLREVGIEAYPVLVYSSDRKFVRPEWPSPLQFDHVILAIKTQAPSDWATITHRTLGRLLLFDPTAERTRLGDLPEDLQGSRVLVAAPETVELDSAPVLANNRLTRAVTAEVTADGALKARIMERSSGQAAAHERSVWASQTPQDYRTLIERWAARGSAGIKATKVEPTDAKGGGFTLEIELEAPLFAQLMQGRLLVLKPAIVARRSAPQLTATTRKYPVVVDPEAFEERARIKLPTGFAVDELPAPLQIEAAFGRYSSRCVVDAGELVFERSLTLRAALIPVEQYADVRGFFQKVADSEQSPAVLIKQ